MLYAVNDAGAKVLAAPKTVGRCPGCGGKVIAKCGSVNVWHWAHESADCDPWHEREGAWHLGWKSMAPPGWTEVVMGPHRADIRTGIGGVIELQASAISAEEIAERERFYGADEGRMVWLLDGRKFTLWRDGPRYAEPCCPTGLYSSDNCGSGVRRGAFWSRFVGGRPPCSGEHHLCWEDNREEGAAYPRYQLWTTETIGNREHHQDSGSRWGRWGYPIYYSRRVFGERESFDWQHRRRSFDTAQAPIFIDKGFGVFQIENRWPGWGGRKGQGRLWSREQFAQAAGLTWRPDAVPVAS